MLLRFLGCLFVSIAIFHPVSAKEIPCPLDAIMVTPGNWNLTPEAFAEQFTEGENKLFTWLTKDRTRAKMSPNLYRDAKIMLTVFDGTVPVQEAIVDFADGRLNLVTLSLYNRGDGGKISPEDFAERFTLAGKAISQSFQSPARARDANPTAGLLTEGFGWASPRGIALLEHNEGAMKGNTQEFLRLRLARPGASGSLAGAMSHSRGGTAARQRDLPRNLSKAENGDVFIAGLPMVDQGDKGYCVVASTQRIFEYYGIGVDMHQIAEITGSDPQLGTNPLTMAKELRKIDYRFKTRLEIIGLGQAGNLTDVIVRRGEYYVGKAVDERKVQREIRNYIDSGLPLLWALELGRAPEVPQLTPQASGGHMRLIIGYNDKTGDVIFSDSWGAGHEFKKMKMADAYKVTHGLFVLKPTVH